MFRNNKIKKELQKTEIKIKKESFDFAKGKAIRNAILEDDTDSLAKLIETIPNRIVNRKLRYYKSDLFLVDWCSEVRRMESAHQITFLELATLAKSDNCIEFLSKLSSEKQDIVEVTTPCGPK